jgi:hypothetical protein
MKKITLTVTRYYYKVAKFEVEVDENLKGEQVREYLSNDPLLDEKFEKALQKETLRHEDTEYHYYDETDKYGGHL